MTWPVGKPCSKGHPYLRTGTNCTYCARERSKKWAEDNADKAKLNQKRTYENNKEAIKTRSKKWAENNKDRVKEIKKLSQSKNKSKTESIRLDRKESDPVYAAALRARTSVANAFKTQGYKKNSKTQEILGCSFEEFKIHLEKQFEEGMSWDNKTEWEIDHIIPISSAETEEDVIWLSKFTNLRPLWKEHNRSKSNKRELLI